jgi:hypothetical protein
LKHQYNIAKNSRRARRVETAILSGEGDNLLSSADPDVG